ncbi:MAG: peptide ABC transporter permease [Chloroflexi bacterium]|nr:MAG: peptide ABC transporter permease [Chloroflexota bacterium]
MTTTSLQTHGPTPAQPVDIVDRPRRGLFRQRFWRSRRVIGGLSYLLLVGAIALLAPVIAPYPERDQNLNRVQLPPFSTSAEGTYHLLGTDALGRDLLSRMMYGARVSLLVGLTVVVVAAIIGVPMGLVSGFFGGWVDTIIMRLVDIQLAVPFILLIIAIMAVLGTGLLNVILVLGISGWVGYARIVRGTVLSLREQPFIEAARCVGLPDWRLVLRHLLPNVWTPVIILATQGVGGAILAESSLTFLGLGISPLIPTWGAMIADGRNYLTTAWWISAFPGVLLTSTVLAIYFLGDGLRDVLDPRLRV